MEQYLPGPTKESARELSIAFDQTAERLLRIGHGVHRLSQQIMDAIEDKPLDFEVTLPSLEDFTQGTEEAEIVHHVLATLKPNFSNAKSETTDNTGAHRRLFATDATGVYLLVNSRTAFHPRLHMFFETVLDQRLVGSGKTQEYFSEKVDKGAADISLTDSL